MPYDVIICKDLADSSDVIIRVFGSATVGEDGVYPVLSLRDLKEGPTHLKLSRLWRAVQKDLCIVLFWEGADAHTLLAPIEGFGTNDFEWASTGLTDPKKEGWTGNLVMKFETESERPKFFSLVLDLTKQRG